MSQRPFISADPAVQFGQPCLNGTRIPARNLAEMVAAGDSVEDTAWAYNTTRAEVLVCCWYIARHDEGDGHGLRTKLRRAWRPWAEQWHQQLARGEWDDVPDPEPVA